MVVAPFVQHAISTGQLARYTLDYSISEDRAMIGALLSSRNRSRTERPSFRPVLETLENREVPSTAQVSAAFDRLPAELSNLQTSLATHNVAAINTNLATVASDMFLLRAGAGGFTTNDRLRIDSTLVADGLRMTFSDFRSLSHIPLSEFTSVLQVGVDAIKQGAEDFLFASVVPATSGNGTLT
jgi:hypothetical protein